MDYATADLHLGHDNIRKFCPRTRGHYKDTDHMNTEIKRIWNETVNPEDLVYILGDVAFLPAPKAVPMIQEMNGKKILIEGNHDRKLLKDSAFRNCFVEVHKYLDIMVNGTKVVMFHYPIYEWDQMHRGSVHLHGHLHGSKTGLENYRIRDASFDSTGNVVTPLNNIVADALKGEIRGHQK